jgi:3-oxoacyl-[acyl-carrier-protein] synthase-3
MSIAKISHCPDTAIGIKAVASYLPETVRSNFETAAGLGIDEQLLRNKIGVETVRCKAPDENTSDMCVAAYKNLLRSLPLGHDVVDFMLVCTQTCDGFGVPHTSAAVHDKLALPEECAFFDVGLGCTGYVFSLSIAQSFMEANGLSTGLVFTAEPYSAHQSPEPSTLDLLFGDAASVTLMGRRKPDEPFLRPGKFLFSGRGQGRMALHNYSGQIQMNGPSIIEYALTAAPQQILRLLQLQDLAKEDVDLFLLHQASRAILDPLRRKLRLSEEQAPTKLRHIGNTISSSIPLLLEDYYRDASKKTILLSSFGSGLSCASCMLHNETTV